MTRDVAFAAAACFAGTVHLVLPFTGGHHPHPPWMVAAFLAVGAGLLLAGAAGARQPAATLAAATAVAYVASRTVGLPGHHAEPLDGLGAVTLVAEALVVALVVVPAAALRRRWAAVPMAALAALPAAAWASDEAPPAPSGCARPTRCIPLEAVQLAEAGPGGAPRLAYRRTDLLDAPSTPGPLIEMTEGECIAVHLTNRVPAETLVALRTNPDHPIGVSLHVHGVKYTQASDGTVGTESFVPPGQSRTYVWYAAPRTTIAGRVTSLGTAGYWWYHDHVVGTSHGTGGVNAGLWGGLIVRRPGDLRPDRTYVVGMGGPGPLINMGAGFACDDNGNRGGRDCFVAPKGTRVEFLVIGIPGPVAGDDFHEFHLHGHNWADNRTGMPAGPADETRVIDAKVIGPSESFGFQVVAGEDVGPGDWMLHCHVQAHSDAGMSTYFRVTGASALPLGSATPPLPAAHSGPVAPAGGHGHAAPHHAGHKH